MFNVSAHRVGVATFACGIDGPLEVARNPRRPQDGFLSCRTLLVPAGELHMLRDAAASMACFFLDPQSDDVEHIVAAMTRQSKSLGTHHAREKEIVLELAKLERDEAAPIRFAERLAALVGLTRHGKCDVRVARAIASMRANPGGTHSLQSLAREVGLSGSRLQHLFKESTGVPLRRFRIWNRMGTAINTAARGSSLTDAALRAGFSSSAHFSTAFRAMFGLSPSDLVRAGLEVISRK